MANGAVEIDTVPDVQTDRFAPLEMHRDSPLENGQEFLTRMADEVLKLMQLMVKPL